MKLVTFILLSLGSAAYAAGPQWAYDTGKQTQNGAIIVKSVNGSTTYASTQNPTGAVAKTNQNATTQPPSVMIMATATLPIKVEGSVCNPVSSGVSPNEMADEGIAITADRSVLLSCQSGVWGKQTAKVPTTQILSFAEAAFVPTTRYCPAGYAAIGSIAISAPSGQSVCLATVFNLVSGTGSQYSGSCAYALAGDSQFSHYLTCMKL